MFLLILVDVDVINDIVGANEVIASMMCIKTRRARTEHEGMSLEFVIIRVL